MQTSHIRDKSYYQIHYYLFATVRANYSTKWFQSVAITVQTTLINNELMWFRSAGIMVQTTLINDKHMQASTLTQTVTGPVGPLKPRIYWSCKIFTGPKKIL